MRGVISWLTYEQMVRVPSGALAIARELGPRGPVAIVIANQALIPVGQTQAVVVHEVGSTGFAISTALHDGSKPGGRTDERPVRAFLDRAAPA
jgi:hypothetical protein